MLFDGVDGNDFDATWSASTASQPHLLAGPSEPIPALALLTVLAAA